MPDQLAKANPENQWEVIMSTYEGLHKDIRLLAVAITDLKADMHHPPCDVMKHHIANHGLDVDEIRKELASHKAVHEAIGERKAQERANTRKFVMNIATIVIAAAIIGIGTLLYTGFIQDVDSKISEINKVEK